jgi:NAD(P)-dependent dehydrogenase (short-subunit alcohol dehydrogenase family)
VYAGCLSPATIRELEGLGHATLVPVLMDITRDKDVQAVMDRIKEEEGGLYALVNNAGRGKRGEGGVGEVERWWVLILSFLWPCNVWGVQASPTRR